MLHKKTNQDVAIFWDYENCHGPSSVSGYDVVRSIRTVAHQYGSVKSFKAYLELSEQSTNPRLLALRSELQSSGVSLTDCPHNGRKNVADQMIIVDMLTYAIDRPPPATVILISGDRDFAYAVSVLRLRHYDVVVISLSTPGAHPSLKAQATECLDWQVDIMAKTEPDLLLSSRQEILTNDKETTSAPRRQSHVAADTLLIPSFSPNQGEARLTGGSCSRHRKSNSIGIRATLMSPSTDDDSISIPFTPIIPVQLPLYQDTADHPSLPSLTSLTCCKTHGSAADPMTEPSPNESITKADDAPMNGTKQVDDNIPTVSPCTKPPKDFAALSKVAAGSSSNANSPPKEPSPHSSINSQLPFVDSNASIQQTREALVELILILRGELQRGVKDVPRFAAACEIVSANVPLRAGFTRLADFLDFAERIGVVRQDGTASVTLLPRWHTGDNFDSLLSGDISTAFGSCTSPRKVGPSVNSPDDVEVKKPSATTISSVSITRSVRTDAVAPSQGYVRPATSTVDTEIQKSLQDDAVTRTQFNTISNLSASAAVFNPIEGLSFVERKSIPSGGSMEAPAPWPPSMIKYKPLVETIRRFKDNGVKSPSRSKVATDLTSRNKSVYEEAGAVSFREYTAMAVKDGVVLMGGKEASAWIELMPKWIRM